MELIRRQGEKRVRGLYFSVCFGGGGRGGGEKEEEGGEGGEKGVEKEVEGVTLWVTLEV